MSLPGHSAGRERGGAIVAAALLLLAVAASLLVQLGSTYKDFNADSNYMLLLVSDLIHGGAVSDWYLAPHYYLFPEAPLTLAILLLRWIGIAPYTGAVVVYGAAWIAVGAVLWREWTGDGLLRAATWASILLSLVYIAIYFFPSHESFLTHLLFPGLHGGTMMMSGLSAVAVSRLVEHATWQRTERILLAGFAVAVALMVFSDFIFVVWGLLPLVPVLASQTRRVPMPRLLTIAGVALSAAVLGYLCSMLAGSLASERYFFSAVLQNWPKSIAAAAAYFWAAATFASPVPGAILYGSVVLWVAAFRAFAREREQPDMSRRNLLLIFMGAASALSVVVTVAPGLFKIDALRMFTPYLWWGAILVVGLIPSLPAARRYAVPILAAGFVIVLAAGGRLYAASSPPAADRLAACLSEKGLTTGVAAFWDALPIMVATDKKIHVVSLEPVWPHKVVPFPWMFKRQWLTHRAIDGAPVQVQFAIVGTRAPNAAALVKSLGTPSGTFECAGRRVLLFDPPAPVPTWRGY